MWRELYCDVRDFVRNSLGWKILSILWYFFKLSDYFPSIVCYNEFIFGKIDHEKLRRFNDTSRHSWRHATELSNFFNVCKMMETEINISRFSCQQVEMMCCLFSFILLNICHEIFGANWETVTKAQKSVGSDFAFRYYSKIYNECEISGGC